ARRGVVGDAAAEGVAYRIGGRRVVVVLRNAGEVRRGNVLEQGPCRRAHGVDRNLVAGQRLSGARIDQRRCCRGEVPVAHQQRRVRGVLIEQLVATVAVV